MEAQIELLLEKYLILKFYTNKPSSSNCYWSKIMLYQRDLQNKQIDTKSANYEARQERQNSSLETYDSFL